MTFLKINHEEAGNGQFELIEEGEYECIIAEAEVKESAKGNPMLKLTITIRNDVKQPHRKQKLWDYLVDTEKAHFKFQQVAKAVGIPSGTVMKTLEDYRLAILFKPVRISVIQEDNTYNGETKKQARIKTYSLATSEYSAPSAKDPFETTLNPNATDFL
jgi:hypothetical protein